MRTRLLTAVITLSTLGSVAFVPVASAARRVTAPIDTTKFDLANSTTVDFMGTRVWIPGIWTTTTDSGSTVFTKNTGEKTMTVTLRKVLTSSCGYQTIRQNLLKAWGSTKISQDRARIEYLKVGTSKYTGYKWEFPADGGREKHWCLPQDGKNSAEIIAPVSDAAFLKFVDGNLLLQLALRRSRR